MHPARTFKCWKGFSSHAAFPTPFSTTLCTILRHLPQGIDKAALMNEVSGILHELRYRLGDADTGTCICPLNDAHTYGHSHTHTHTHTQTHTMNTFTHQTLTLQNAHTNTHTYVHSVGRCTLAVT
jgi:hypothetical protein